MHVPQERNEYSRWAKTLFLADIAVPIVKMSLCARVCETIRCEGGAWSQSTVIRARGLAESGPIKSRSKTRRRQHQQQQQQHQTPLYWSRDATAASLRLWRTDDFFRMAREFIESWRVGCWRMSFWIFDR